jgi:hypothetical protein
VTPGQLAVFGGVSRCLSSDYIRNSKLAIYFLNL